MHRLGLELDVARQLLRERSAGVFIWEFFSGEMHLTRSTTYGGHHCGVPCGLRAGVDLTRKPVHNAMLTRVRYFKPWLCTMAFPCSPLSPLQTLFGFQNNEPIEDTRDRHEEQSLTFVAKLMRLQAYEGRLGLAENPLSSAAWRTDTMASLINEGLHELVHGDQCA